MRYTDIGHSNDDDQIWICDENGFEKVNRIITSSQAQPWTHHLLWGGAANLRWRGRFDSRTKICSVLPPENTQPKMSSGLLWILMAAFSPSRIVFFPRDAESESVDIPFSRDSFLKQDNKNCES